MVNTYVLESERLDEQINGWKTDKEPYDSTIKIVSSRKIGRIIFTVFRDNYNPIHGSFPKSLPNLNTDYLLLDFSRLILDSYLDADLIIIGGGKYGKYIAPTSTNSKIYRSL